MPGPLSSGARGLFHLGCRLPDDVQAGSADRAGALDDGPIVLRGLVSRVEHIPRLPTLHTVRLHFWYLPNWLLGRVLFSSYARLEVTQQGLLTHFSRFLRSCLLVSQE